MIRTQIQLPDELYASAKRLSSRLEISLAELVRRGLEYIVATTPSSPREPAAWSLPEPTKLGGRDPFVDDNWRSDLHTANLRVAEDGGRYGRPETDS